MSKPASLNLYDILGVTKDATPEEVRKAYRKRALQTHPDRLPQNATSEDKQAAEAQFRLVNNAYEVLNDTKNRELYDLHGVWPPPTERIDAQSHSEYSSGFPVDPFTDPFFRGTQWTFTDPFELFHSLFGDIHAAFENDPFLGNTPFSRSPFDDPLFRSPFASSPLLFGGPLSLSRSTPFGGPFISGNFFSGSPLGGVFLTGPSMDTSNTRVYSSRSQTVSHNGHFVSQSQTFRTINGRTESITKRTDAEGNEYTVYSSPDGTRYTINGIERSSSSHIEAPTRSKTRHAAISDRPAEPPVSVTPPLPAQSYNVPIASGSHHYRTYAQPQPAPPTQPSRRETRHSRRERAMTEDPRRSSGAHVPSQKNYISAYHDADLPMPGRYVSNHGHDPSALGRRPSKSSRHSARHTREAKVTSMDHDREGGHIKTQNNDMEGHAGSPTTAKARGWRGW